MPVLKSRPAPLMRLLALLVLSLMSGTARAATLAVINANDSGPGSLRAAISTANGDGGNGTYDTIRFALPAGSVITVTSTLSINAPMTIQGPGAANLAIDGGHTTGSTGVQVFSISGGTPAQPVTLSGLTIRNGFTFSNGGGVNINNNDALVLTGCALAGNSTPITGSSSGGGINNDGTVTVTGCTFTGNSANRGGCINNNRKANVTGCTLAGNTGGNFGSGGINNNGTLTVTNCMITGNSTSSSLGGGVNNFGTATLTGCAIAGNSATNGGGVFNGSTLTMTGCTLTGNSATSASGGGGLYNGYNDSATLTDDIIYSNETGGEIVQIGSGTISATYCDVQGGYTGTGNINQDPRFVTPYTSSSAPFDLHLQSSSPCIGKGVSVPYSTYDIAGVPRFAPPSIGAYEYYSGTYTVTNTSATGSGSLAGAVTYANSHPYTVILFDPAVFAAPQKITPGATLTISAPTAILGPSAGVAVDGGHTTGSTGVQVFAIASGSGKGLSAISLTIQNGYISNNDGGGIYINSGALALTGCTLTGNSAHFGGGIYNNGGALALTGCTFTGNSATSGGAINNFSTATLTGCTLAGNTGGNTGSGGINNDGTLTVINCMITGNSTSSSLGGGVNNFGTATLTGCAIAGNSAQFGGGIFNARTLTLTGCTLTGNSATGAGGGGGINNRTGTATLTDDIIYNNETGGEISNNGSTIIATCCDVQGGYTGTGNINQDPLFVSAPGDLHLQSGSPCAAAGTATAPAYLPFDIDGRPRPTPPNSNPSIGAYEAAPSGAYALVVRNILDGVPQSLRAAVQCADDYPVAGITFDPVVFSAYQTIALTSGELALSQPMTITGPAPGVAVSGNSVSCVFEISSGTFQDPVTLTGLTIENGYTSGNGGGVLVDSGYVTLTGCTLAQNSAGNQSGSGGFGGGIANNGSLTLTGCVLTGNSSAHGGGGIYNPGTATLTDCALTGNSGGNYGGGVENVGGMATLINCLLAGNSASYGGGLYNDAPATLTGCTFTGNSGGNGGGVLVSYGTTTLTDDILYGDNGGEIANYDTATASYCDIGEAIGTQSNSDGVADNGHNINADPRFVTPYTNSSTPFDLHVKPGSPVVGAGTTSAPNYLPYDFDGKPRANPPTIGAYEGIPATTSTTVASSANPSVYGQSVTFTATVANTTQGSSAVPTGMVVFTIDSTPYAAASQSVVNGKVVATYTTSSLSVSNTPHSVSANYTPAANNFIGSNGSLNGGQTVSKANTTTSVTSSLNPSSAGQQVTFTATVAASAPGAGTPTGTVTFTIDNVAQSPAATLSTVNNQQVATYTTSTLTVNGSPHSVSANYSGDGSFVNSSGSLAGGQTVTAGAAAKLVVSAPATATVGKSIQVTVAAQDTFGNPVTSTATVSFTSTDPRAVLPAPTALVNGTATVNVTYYTAGQQTLTASASGLTSGTAPTTVSSDPSGTPSVAVSNVTLTRTNSTTVTVTFSLVNTGVGQANNVAVTVAKLGTVGAASLPAPTTIGAGQSVPYSLTFTGVAAGANTLTLNGSYANAAATTSYAFSGGKKVTVP